MVDKKKAKEEVMKIQDSMFKLGDLITKARTQKEADEIYDIIHKNIYVQDLAKTVWDYMVEWDEVKWKEKLKKVI